MLFSKMAPFNKAAYILLKIAMGVNLKMFWEVVQWVLISSLFVAWEIDEWAF